MSKGKFIVVTGPTATGKTKISVEIARRLNSEIISADSVQIYRGMNIGSAKVTPGEARGIRHHFVDIVSPGEEYSAALFQRQAFSLIDDLNARGLVPVVAGGTGLYVNSLVYDLDFSKTPKNDALRQKFKRLADDNGIDFLYNVLKGKDPAYASVIAPTDLRRIIRRLEIIETSGVSSYDFRKPNDDYDIVIIGLTIARETLYERVNARVDTMMDTGLLEEVKTVYDAYGDVPALKAIGYKELIGHLRGEYGLDEAIRLIKRNTRRFAKRQMTWFKKDERIFWFDVLKHAGIEDTVCDIMGCIKGKGF